MNPGIRYVRAPDGVRIAHCVVGEGPALVCMPHVPWSHIELEWREPRISRWYQRLAAERTVVRYDNRGSGLSDRDVGDYSLEAQLRDLQAVVDRLGLENVELMAPLNSGPVAIAYAAGRPERVSRLILWCTYAFGREYGSSEQLQATRKLLDQDWEVYTETIAHVAYGWREGEEARQFAGFIRECVGREAVLGFLDAIERYDVRDMLSLVKAPTLVLHRRGFTLPGLDVARRLTAEIPDARLTILEGSSPGPFFGDADSVLAAIGEFLGLELRPLVEAGRSQPPVTILFTDMEGSTALTQRRGDAQAQEVLRAHNEIAREALRTHGGSEIKHTGDGIMASFASGSRAISAALAMQRGLAAHNETHPEAPIRVRIGLNAGEPVAEEGDLFGTAVQLAARIAAHAEPGRVLVSNVVRELAAGKGFLFSDRGDVGLRGFEDPVRLYEVMEG